MMKVVSFLIKILKYIVLSFLVSNFDILADSLQQSARSKRKNTARVWKNIRETYCLSGLIMM